MCVVVHNLSVQVLVINKITFVCCVQTLQSGIRAESVGTGCLSDRARFGDCEACWLAW